MAAATAVESTTTATTMESAATATESASAATEPTTTEATSSYAAVAASEAANSSSIAEATAANATESVAAEAASIEAAAEPRTSTDEDAAVKPRRTIVTIGSTRIRVVVVIPIRAGGRPITVSVICPHPWTHPDAHSNLRMGVSHWDKQN